MQQTEKYQFNLIDTSDAFSPTPLNENTQAMETELARMTAQAAADKATLLTALGSGGKTARIAWGSYVGSGTSITVDFKPLVLIYAFTSSATRVFVMLREHPIPLSSNSTGITNVTWGDRTVSWKDIGGHSETSTNYYVVIGESDG